MQHKKHFLSAVLCSTLLFVLPLAAHAELTIANNSDSNVTEILNDSFCSSDFGEQGILKAHSSISIDPSQLNMVCGITSSCKADIYLSDNCSGTKAGTIFIDVNLGVTNTESSEALNIIAVNPFNVQLNPN